MVATLWIHQRHWFIESRCVAFGTSHSKLDILTSSGRSSLTRLSSVGTQRMLRAYMRNLQNIIFIILPLRACLDTVAWDVSASAYEDLESVARNGISRLGFFVQIHIFEKCALRGILFLQIPCKWIKIRSPVVRYVFRKVLLIFISAVDLRIHGVWQLPEDTRCLCSPICIRSDSLKNARTSKDPWQAWFR